MKELVSKEFIDNLKEKLTSKEQTLAVAESVTSGILQAVCSSATGAALFFQGGVTVYNLGQKAIQLGVEPIHAEQCNCVSEKVASQMALGVCSLFKSDWGIGITGYASPVPESGNRLFAYCAIAFKDEIVTVQRIEPGATGFFQAQLEYGKKAIELLKQQLG